VDNRQIRRWNMDENKREDVKNEVKRCLMRPRMNLYILCMERKLMEKRELIGHQGNKDRVKE